MISAGLIASICLAAACAVLSVFVVSRRWAFVGEGIGHAGFGGAGTAWVLSLMFPALAAPAATYAIAVTFCFVMAIGIAYFSRRRRVHVDTVIGIFLVASIAWGLTAQGIFSRLNHQQPPANWEDYLIGRWSGVSMSYAFVAAAVSIAAVAIVAMLWKEIISYCFDPAMAEVTGVRVSLVHYTLILLLAMMIVVGLQLTGPLLIPALLILPGAAAMQLARQLKNVIAISVIAALLAAVIGSTLHAIWPFIPPGPAIVLTMFLEFLVAYTTTALHPRVMPT